VRRFLWLAVLVGAVLLVFFGVIGLTCGLASGAWPGEGDRGREATLRTDLRTFRDVIGQFRADRGEYPPSLAALVEEGYLRAIPVDPMTESSETWVLSRGGRGGVVNVRSASTERGSDGRRHSEW
jgi:general secretion pathway protein G